MLELFGTNIWIFNFTLLNIT